MPGANIFPEPCTQKYIMATVPFGDIHTDVKTIAEMAKCLSHVIIGPITITDDDINQTVQTGKAIISGLKTPQLSEIIQALIAKKLRYKSMKIIIGLRVDTLIRNIANITGESSIFEQLANLLLEFSLQNDIDGYEIWTQSIFNEVTNTYKNLKVVNQLKQMSPGFIPTLEGLYSALKTAVSKCPKTSQKHIPDHENSWKMHVGIKIGPSIFCYPPAAFDTLYKYDWIHLKCHGFFLQNECNSPLRTKPNNAEDYSYETAIENILAIKQHGFLPKFVFEAPSYASTIINDKVKITPYSTFRDKYKERASPEPEIGAEYVEENGSRNYVDTETISGVKASFIQERGIKGYSISNLTTDISYTKDESIIGAYYRATEFMDTSFANISPETYEKLQKDAPNKPSPAAPELPKQPEIAQNVEKNIEVCLPETADNQITVELTIKIKSGPNSRTIKLVV